MSPTSYLAAPPRDKLRFERAAFSQNDPWVSTAFFVFDTCLPAARRRPPVHDQRERAGGHAEPEYIRPERLAVAGDRDLVLRLELKSRAPHAHQARVLPA